MMRTAAVLMALTVAIASPALAQGKGHGKSEGNGHGNEHGNVVVKAHGHDKVTVVTGNSSGRARAHGNSGVVTRRTTTSSKGGAPAFCRSGAGHPVYGRAWCVEKGFGLGNNHWNRTTWSDVVLQPRRATLGDVLSSVVLGRLTNYAAGTLGLSAPLNGTWLTNTPDRRVYIVRSGSTPVAEMVDTNRDGRADYVLLYK